MKKEIKEKWVAALASGKYRQTDHCLRSGDSFCCLGVLCDIHSKETGNEWNKDIYLGRADVLPVSVIEWAGVENNSPSVGDQVLATLNDTGYSFKEISAIIERGL